MPSAAPEGPDLIVGYDRGYGASDESTLGEITEAVFEDNTSRWSGNHLMAPEVVPGVLRDEPRALGQRLRPHRSNRHAAGPLWNRAGAEVWSASRFTTEE